MSGQGCIQRKKQRNREIRNKQLTNTLLNGIHTYKSLGIDAEESFQSVTVRVKWLNDKIAWNQANGIKFMFYVHERESLFWMMDKIKELSEKLLNRAE